MRKLTLLAVPLLAFMTLPAPGQTKKNPYQVEFDREKDIERLEVSPDGKKKGIYVKVKFAITLDGSKSTSSTTASNSSSKKTASLSRKSRCQSPCPPKT